MTTVAIHRSATVVIPSIDATRVQPLLRRLLRIAIVGYCLLGLVSYAPKVDASGHCDCPFCNLP